jgi:hypothetical protein
MWSKLFLNDGPSVKRQSTEVPDIGMKNYGKRLRTINAVQPIQRSMEITRQNARIVPASGST